MAQSSDSNNSNYNNKGLDSADAEKILDSIIGHIEATDKPVGAEGLSIDDGSKPADIPAEQQARHEGHKDTNSKTDYRNIEQRATQLANMLGNAGLSYSVGAKKHLDDIVSNEEADGQKDMTAIKASIHDDDLEMDGYLSGSTKSGQANEYEPDAEQHIAQTHDVSEWEADVQAEHEDEELAAQSDEGQGGETITSPSIEEEVIIEEDTAISSPHEVFVEPIMPLGMSEPASSENPEPGSDENENVAVAVTDDDMTIEEVPGSIEQVVFFNENNFVEEESCVEDETPDLRNIERQIEALSVSMKEQSGSHDEKVNGTDQINEATSAEPLSNEVHERVSSLEMQIVQLLDKMSLSDQKLGDDVLQSMRNETQSAVQDAIASSSLLETLKFEMENIGEERRLQERRMSDSLDVLHDALKDMSERIDVVEHAGTSHQESFPDVPGLGGGIATSVLGTQLNIGSVEKTEDIQPRVNQGLELLDVEEEAPKSDEPVDYDMPTWLEDSTQDLHRDDNSQDDEPADVFTTVDKEEGSLVENVISSTIEKSDIENIPSNELDASEDDVMPAESVDDQNRGVKSILEEKAQNGQSQIDDKQLSNTTRGLDYSGAKKVDPKSEKIPVKGNGFLHAARAAAQAANERARILQEESEKGGSERGILKRKGNFIAAAKQKQRQQQVELKPVQETTKKPAKNSLFKDKVEGPNSLLVFTSLILFGTSALLLYGMSRNSTETGSVTTLNAVEKKSNHQTTKSIPASDKKMLTKKPRSGERSNLEGNSEHVEPVLAGTSDTLTTYDRMVQNRMAALSSGRSAIEFTGSLAGAKQKQKENSVSLFDEYVSFSALKSINSEKRQNWIDKTGGSSRLLASASGGNAHAQYELAQRFGKGIGVEKSPAISVEWFEKSAHAGYAPAIYRLATMYERGNGVPKDYSKALQLYTQAADKGNVKAMHNLAVLFTGGNLGTADYKRAVKWYNNAANYGVKDSQFNLAIIYQNGMGGTQDLPKAYKWYNLAAQSGDEEAKELMRELREELSSAQRRKIDTELQNWKSKIPDENANAAREYGKKSASATTGSASKL